VKGDVVVLPFPFSDLSSSKKRPALVTAVLENNEIILCQITSQARLDKYSIILLSNDFKRGGLNLTSVVRPNRIFTVEKSIVLYRIGSVNQKKLNEVLDKIISIFKD